MKSIHDLTEFYLRLIYNSLRKEDSFLSLSSPTPRFNSNVVKFSTTFSNAIIMMNLMESKSSIAKKILKTLNHFLRAQRNKQASFNYWNKNVPEYENIPYPDDLDDTFCALTALYEYNNKYLTGKDMRSIIELLVHQESKIGGPYYTWVTGGDDIEWKDIDLAVNSNIAFFLLNFDIDLPNISNLVEAAIANNRVVSRYYPQSTPVAYFISKWYRGKKKRKLISILERMHDLPSSTFLDKLLVATALLNYGLCDHIHVQSILQVLKDKSNVTNVAYPFYRGVNPLFDGKKYYSGSRELTLSFVVEFLNLYYKVTSTSQDKKSSYEDSLIRVNKVAFESVEKELIAAQGEIKISGLNRLNIMSKNPDMPMITSIPYITYKSLNSKLKIRNEVLANLSLATLLGWLAYDIYDDFFDDHGSPSELSVANFALRKLTDIFTSDNLPSEFHEYFHKTMITVDNANAKESKRELVKVHRGYLLIDKKIYTLARSVNRLHEKSIGHILGVVAVYTLLNKSIDSLDISHTVRFFENYLSARQIVDDMHDWEEDLSVGKLNSSTAQMVIDTYKRGQNKISIQQLRQLFWEVNVTKLCKKAKKHIKLAENNSKIFVNILKPLSDVLNETIREQKNALQFLTKK